MSDDSFHASKHIGHGDLARALLDLGSTNIKGETVKHPPRMHRYIYHLSIPGRHLGIFT